MDGRHRGSCGRSGGVDCRWAPEFLVLLYALGVSPCFGGRCNSHPFGKLVIVVEETRALSLHMGGGGRMRFFQAAWSPEDGLQGLSWLA